MSDKKLPALSPAEDLALALGFALGGWNKVEAELFQLYMVLCRAGVGPNAANTIYETLIHIEVKLNVLAALVKLRFDASSETFKTWSTLENKLRRRAKNVRNKLAHWPIWGNQDGSDYFINPQLLVPSLKKRREFGKPHTGAMRAKDLHEHSDRFRELSEEVRKFTEDAIRSLRDRSRA